MDFNVLLFPLPLVFSVFIAVAVIIVIFVSGKKSKLLPDYGHAVPVIEIVKALEKLCPINCLNKWQLFPFDHGCHRCWTHSITEPFVNNNINLYGSATTISSSPMLIYSLIADVTKWSEWNPFFTSQYIVKSFHDKQLRRDHYMEAEQVVSIVRETNKIQSHTFMYRFHDFSENKVGWILFWNPKKLEFLYFLIQPVKNRKDDPVCLLTHIMGTESKLFASSISLVSQRLRNIEDLLTLSSLQIVPSNFMPSSHFSTEHSASDTQLQPLSITIQENYFSLSSIQARKRDIRNTVFILVPFVPSVHDFWKVGVEFKLAVKSMESGTSKKKPSLPPGSKELLSEDGDESLSKRPVRRSVSDVGIKSKVLSDQKKISDLSNISESTSVSKNKKIDCKPENGFVKVSKQNSEVIEETKSNSSSKEKLPLKSKLRSLSETAVNNLDNCEFSYKSAKTESYQNSVSKLQDINENVEDKLLAMDEQVNKEIFNSSLSDFEIVEKCEFSENQIAAFMTQGNYGAAELQAEVLIASHYLHAMNSGNYQSIGDWTFHSYHKGLCVLTKTTCCQFLKMISFLCQTEIPVAPKDVWKFVKYPQFRFICDESVKSVEVLEKISSSQKLIHTYHEVGRFIKKELIDFCLLQTEREELNRYYSSFCSIEFYKCPFMKSVTRGTLRPSGWIVEKIDKDPNKSIVTFLMQVLISSPDSMFIQELSIMVPQSVHNLTNYITSKPV